MPVIAKTILPAGTYDEKAMLRENMEKEMARLNICKEQKLKELYYTLSQQMDTEAITAFFDISKETRNEKIKTFSNKWKEAVDKEKTFASLWKSMKLEILTGEEP